MKIRTRSAAQFLPGALCRAALIAGALSASACADATPERGATEPVEPTETITPERPSEPAVVVTTPPDATARAAKIDENLAKLANLDLFEVGELLTDTDRAGGSCYGYPCPEEREAIELRLATALDKLVALTADLTPAASGCSAMTVDTKTKAHLALLDQLNVVDVGSFLAVDPANNAMCYNLPCTEDIEAATAINCDKAARLETLALRAAAAFEAPPPLVFGALSADAELDVSNDLGALANLDIFEVGSMIIHPADSNCYVCPGPDATLADTAAQLDRLVATAQTNIAQYRDTDPQTFAGCDPQVGATALAALAALEVVEVGSLIERDAADEGLCYRGNCSDDNEATARAWACRRADAAQRLVAAVQAR